MRPYFPCSDLRGIKGCPLATQKEVWLHCGNMRVSLRFPEVPDAAWEEPRASGSNSRKTKRFPSQHKMRLDSPVATQEQSRVPPHNSKGGLTACMELQRFSEIPVATREESRVSRRNSRRAPCSPPHFEMSAYSPASTQEESRLFPRTSRGGLSHLLQLERNSSFLPQVKRKPSSPSTRDKAWFPCSDVRWIQSSPSQLKRNSEFPITIQEKHQVSHHSLKETPFPTTSWEKPWVPHCNSRWGSIPL